MNSCSVLPRCPLASRIAAAETYPSRPVRILVATSAGGGTDLVARFIAQWLTERLGQSFFVENRAGGGNNIGTEMAARSPADGYTLFMANTVNTINNSLYQKLNYNFIADFAPVANVMGTPLLVLVHPSVAAKNAAELIALAKASPGKLNLASGGVGSTGHMSAELFQMMAGIKFTHVPYRGEAPALTDLIAGQAQVMVSTTGSSLQYARAGTVRALATTTDDRVARTARRAAAVEDGAGLSGQRLERPLCAERNASGDHHLAQQGGEPRDSRSEDQGAHRQPRGRRAARFAGGLRPDDRGRHRQVGQGRAVLRRARELNARALRAGSRSADQCGGGSIRAGTHGSDRVQGRGAANSACRLYLFETGQIPSSCNAAIRSLSERSGHSASRAYRAGPMSTRLSRLVMIDLHARKSVLACWRHWSFAP